MAGSTRLLIVVAFLSVAVAIVATVAGDRHADGQAASSMAAVDATAGGGAVAARDTVPSEHNVSDAYRTEVAVLHRQLATMPADTVALRRLGRLLQDAHQPAEAASLYRRYLVLQQHSREVWLDLIGAYATAGQWDSARVAASALLALRPDDPTAMYNLGAIHANMGDANAARTWWTRVQDQGTDETLAARAEASLQRLANAAR